MAGVENWSIKGQWFDACRCAIPCPCSWAQPPDAIDASPMPADARELIALTALAGGSVPVNDVLGWEPVYGRPAEAQAQWERSHGRPLSSAPGLAG